MNEKMKEKEKEEERQKKKMMMDEPCAVVACSDALQFYSSLHRRRRFTLGQRKIFVQWIRQYIVVVTDDERGLLRVRIFDIHHKLMALSFPLRATSRIAREGEGGRGEGSRTPPITSRRTRQEEALLRGDGDVLYIVDSGNCLFLLTSTHRIYRLREKGIEQKLSDLRAKRLYSVAISMASAARLDSLRIMVRER